MSNFFTEYYQRSWKCDLERYKRYASMAARSDCQHIQAIAVKSRNYIRGQWPTHETVFNDIDTECNSVYNFVPTKER